jgi:Fe-S oxidoreductase
MSANVQTGHPDVSGLRARIQGLHGRAAAPGGSDEARLARAKDVMLREIDGQHAMYLESCIRCGMCAEACHFYQGTGTPEYTPIYKTEPLKNFYRRELGPMRWLRRLYTPDVTLRDLQRWQPLAYDACTECGRCDLICPMGIQISPLIGIMRRALAAADLLPAELAAVAEEQKTSGTVFGVGADAVRALASQIEARGQKVPVDLARADIVVLTSAVDVKGFPGSLEALATLLNRVGANWTLLSDSIALIGTGESLREISVRRLVEEVLQRDATSVILPECGHAYPALRFDSAHMIGEPVPFQVWSAIEWVGREIQAGRLKVRKAAGGKVTYHDPCKIGRHGGVFDEPRAAIAALGLELREMESHARTNFCCGGGGGQFLIERAAPLRARAFEIKMHEADATGAAAVLTACNSCRLNYINGAENANWQMPVQSLVELVAANLD